MRKVVSNQEVCDLWLAQSQDYARNAKNTFYFSGNTIYSYGTHFPIAMVCDGYVLFTTKGYRNTTAKQKFMVRATLERARRATVTVPDFSNPEKCYKEWLTSAERKYEKAKKSRRKDVHVQLFRNYAKNFLEYERLTGNCLPDGLLVWIDKFNDLLH